MIRKQIRKFRLRTQYRVGKDGAATVRLVSSRRILKKDKSITAGQAVDRDHKLSATISKPKARIKGDKIRGRA